jgi:hypothetical protein
MDKTAQATLSRHHLEPEHPSHADHPNHNCPAQLSRALGRDAGSTTIRGRPSRLDSQALGRDALPTIVALLPNAVDV